MHALTNSELSKRKYFILADQSIKLLINLSALNFSLSFKVHRSMADEKSKSMSRLQEKGSLADAPDYLGVCSTTVDTCITRGKCSALRDTELYKTFI